MSDHDTVGEVKKNFLNQDFLKETKVQDLLNKVKEGLLANLLLHNFEIVKLSAHQKDIQQIMLSSTNQ